MTARDAESLGIRTAIDRDSAYPSRPPALANLDLLTPLMPRWQADKLDAIGNAQSFLGVPSGVVDELKEVEPETFPTDKAYDADALIDALVDRNMTVVILSRANRLVERKTDFALHRMRNRVERFFRKLKGFRAIATRYDKRANTFLAAIQFVCIVS
eukprot:gene9693-13071_t